MKINIKLVILTIVGNLFIAFGISLLNLSKMGLDAFTAMNLGVSSLLNVGLGIYQSLFNIVLLIPVVFFNKKSIGIGTIINMFLLGYVVEFISYLFGLLNFTAVVNQSIIIKVILLLAGLVISCFGAAIYMECDLGVGPYDALGPIIENKTNIPFKFARMGTDILCAIIGFIAGYISQTTTIGIATILFALLTGPIISFFRFQLLQKHMKKLK